MSYLRKNPAFTVIELLGVIVIIGILSSISVQVYTGYAERARVSAGRAMQAQVIRKMGLEQESETGYWQFEENPANTATDVSIRDNHSSAFLSGVTWEAADGATERSSQSINIDTSVLAIDPAAAYSEPRTAFTVSAFMKLVSGPDDASEYGIFRKTNGGAAGDYQFSIYDTGSIVFTMRDDVAAAQSITAAAGTIEVDKWYHILMTYDGTDFTAYVDGTREDTLTLANPPTLLNQATNFSLGNADVGAAIEIRFDEMHIWTAGFSLD